MKIKDRTVCKTLKIPKEEAEFDCLEFEKIQNEYESKRTKQQ